MTAISTTGTYPIYPTATGSICPNCGIWVQFGQTHVCYQRPSTTTTFIINPPKEEDVSDYELKQLSEIVSAMESARKAFESLDDETHGRVLDFLSGRFGVEDNALRQVLMEER
jgi:hypothetical protein